MKRVCAGGITAAAMGMVMFSAVSLEAQRYDDCDHQRAVSQELALDGATAMTISAGAGSLEVRGVRGLRAARVRGTACASSSALLAEISVRTERRGSTGRIETVFPEDRRDGTARIDLVIEVPEGIAATISDGSGNAGIRGIGELTVTDGSGELTIEDIMGDVVVTDGSGSLSLRGIAGFVTVTDGSGDVDFEDVGGVRVSDGSGSIRADGVRGDFVVESDGSGSIGWDRVGGRVDVPEAKRSRWF